MPGKMAARKAKNCGPRLRTAQRPRVGGNRRLDPPQRSRQPSYRDQDWDEAAQRPQEEGEVDGDEALEAQEHQTEPRPQSSAVLPPRRHAAAAGNGGQAQNQGHQLDEPPVGNDELVEAMVAAMQLVFRQQRRQDLWMRRCMRRWMAQIYDDLRDINLTIQHGFQNLIAVLAAQPHQPEGSVEGQVPGPSGDPPPPPDDAQQQRGRGQGPVRGEKRKRPQL
ncbi:uncharacterized protein LOC108709986 [Xenopus laevis]|uniref:Uncharacterized protein LOC108709986 n=2 Tax=Xenopus laevis TaxID=8355 RepID=A0A1L8HAV3_XENLA|nr:uncharacterized protein LOC108709986 [Xenopus laevis]OCT93209.1 hypothetical protein XELAEV_18016274mg [Xenopus laevis]